MKGSAKMNKYIDGTVQVGIKPTSHLREIFRESFIKLIKQYSIVFMGLAGLVLLMLTVYALFQIF